jgi:acetolactate synthase small subunit
MEKRTLMVTTENRPDVVARISGLLSARAVRLESIVGAPAENPDFYRIRLVVAAEKGRIEHVAKQITQLVDTVKVVDVTRDNESAVHRFLLLKVNFGRGEKDRAPYLRDFRAMPDPARPDMCIDLTDPALKSRRMRKGLCPAV